MNYSPDELELLRRFYELVEMIKAGSSNKDQMDFLAKNPQILNGSNRKLLRQIAQEPKYIDDLLDSLRERYQIFNKALIEAALELYNADDNPKKRILPAIMLFENAKTIEERRKIILEGGLLLDEATAIIDYCMDATQKTKEQGRKNSLKAVKLLKHHRQAMALPPKSTYLIDLHGLISPFKNELFHQPGTVLDIVPNAVKICHQIANVVLTFLDKNISATTTLYEQLKTFVNEIGELEELNWDSMAIDRRLVGIIKMDNDENFQYPTIKIRKTQFATFLLAHELCHLLVHIDSADLYDGHSFSAKYDDEKEDFLSEVDQMFQDRIIKVAEAGTRYFIEEFIADTIASFIILPKSFPLKTELSRFGPPIWGYPGVRALHQTASYSVVRDAVVDKAKEFGVELTEDEIREYILDAGETTFDWVSMHIQIVEKYSTDNNLSVADIEIAYMWLAFLNKYTEGKVQYAIEGMRDGRSRKDSCSLS